MKTLEIDETETHLVIRALGSDTAHMIPKKDAEDVRDTLLAVLAEVSVTKPVEEQTAPESSSDDGSDMGFEEAARTAIGALETFFKKPEVQKVKTFLEKMPKNKRHVKSG